MLNSRCWVVGQADILLKEAAELPLTNPEAFERFGIDPLGVFCSQDPLVTGRRC